MAFRFRLMVRSSLFAYELNDAVSNLVCMASNDTITNTESKDFGRTWQYQLKSRARHLPGGTEENYEKRQ
jgi:hypothetical protein